MRLKDFDIWSLADSERPMATDVGACHVSSCWDLLGPVTQRTTWAKAMSYQRDTRGYKDRINAGQMSTKV